MTKTIERWFLSDAEYQLLRKYVIPSVVDHGDFDGVKLLVGAGLLSNGLVQGKDGDGELTVRLTDLGLRVYVHEYEKQNPIPWYKQIPLLLVGYIPGAQKFLPPSWVVPGLLPA